MSSQSVFAHGALARIAVSSDVVRVSGEIDISNVGYLAERLTDAIKGERRTLDIIVDLTELTFLDAQGLDTLVTSQSLAHNSGRRLVLANPPAMVRKLLRLTGLGEVLPVLGLGCL